MIKFNLEQPKMKSRGYQRSPDPLFRNGATGAAATAIFEVRLDREEQAASGTMSPSSAVAGGVQVDEPVARKMPDDAFLKELKDFNFSKQERPLWVPLSE